MLPFVNPVGTSVSDTKANIRSFDVVSWASKGLALALAALVAMVLPAGEARAQGARADHGPVVVSVHRWVEEWDPAARRWVKVEDTQTPADNGSENFRPTASSTRLEIRGGAFARLAGPIDLSTDVHKAAGHQVSGRRGPAVLRYGPFEVRGRNRAALVGATDARTPGQFDAMLRDFPGLQVIELVEAPGTSNDIANLALGRRIREAGLHTHVPTGGSVRSGAVELFLAGETRSIDRGARFAVHSWLDTHGREAHDFAPGAPEHRMYLDYYMEMGMSARRARAFYDMTNSVPHHSALWLRSDEMRQWIDPASPDLAPRNPARRLLREQPVLALQDGARALSPLLDASVELLAEPLDALPVIAYGDVIRVAPVSPPAIAWSRIVLRDS
ncbi:hypothetical protein SAMN04515621_1729 [Erythrobacter sp. HL-111]|nr:MAG: Rad4 transglutaminase-like domain [Erythrobacteraceae bacterium HL-111]SDS52694.1 hypothetical protein SAMN04515621_1729 [Erythrobacter sp. HL-111]